MPDIISVIIALVLVIVAAVHDLREFRIPNRLIVAGIVVGVSVIVIRAFTGEYIGNYILGTLAGLAGMTFLYIIRAVGAGDVKLLDWNLYYSLWLYLLLQGFLRELLSCF